MSTRTRRASLRADAPRAAALAAIALLATAGVALARAASSADAPAGGPRGAQNGEWPTYHGDLYATQYAALDQITAENVGQLAVAWRWSSPDNAIAAADRKFQPWGFKSTPLMVGGRLYVNTSLGHVAALMSPYEFNPLGFAPLRRLL